jgi:hypothetical protein
MPTETDIRVAFRALAEQAPDAETVLAAVTAPSPQLAAARRRSVRVLAPLAAAAAVAAVIALAVGISGTTQRARRIPAPPAAVLPAVSFGCTRPDSECIPRYYLFISGSIKDRITGATVAVVHLPQPYHVIDAVAGAADDRTFVLAAQTRKAYGSRPVKLFLAQFDPARRSVTVSALPIPVPQTSSAPVLNGLALSPDGRMLAIGDANTPTAADSTISVYSLTGRITGLALRVWQGVGAVANSAYDPSGVSWSSSGMLAINWLTGQKPTTGVRLLNTAAPSGSLLAHSRFVVNSWGTFDWDGVLTPDGARIVAVVAGSQPSAEQIEEYSASTGKPVLTLDARTGIGDGETLEWTNSSGSLLVVAQSPGPGKPVEFGLLGGGEFRPIPGAPAPTGSWFEIAF